MLRTLSGVAVLILCSAGCGVVGGECDPTCNFSGAPTALLGGGTSQTGFVNLSDGDEMTVTLGPQGLYMVTPSVRVQNMDTGQSGQRTSCEPEVLIEIIKDGSVIGGSAREHIGLTKTANGGEALGVFTPFTAETDYLGMVVTLRAQVSDACGNSATDELDVRAVQ